MFTCLFVAATLAAPLEAVEVDPLPPSNVFDPARPNEHVLFDHGLPFLYLEPHAGCLDVAGPMPLTLAVLNMSDKPQAVDWAAVVASLHLKPVGPGTATPKPDRPRPAAVTVPPRSVAEHTLDLKDCFTLTGGSVYRLSAARPLPDGRLHIAPSVSFLAEDGAALDAAVAAVPAGPTRDTLRTMLRANPLFTAGGGWKPDILDKGRAFVGRSKPLPARWDEPTERAMALWTDGLPKLVAKDGGADQSRARDVLVDRLLLVSDGFRRTPGHHVHDLDKLAEANLPPAERERLNLRLARARDHGVAGRAINRLMEMRNPAAVEVFIAVADGPDQHLATEALRSLGDYRPTPRIVEFLRRKMGDPDPKLALEAAITTCYSGDWSGYPVLIRCARSPDPALRLKAIGQLCSSDVFREKKDEIVPILLAEVEKPLSDELLESALYALGNYPSPKAMEVMKAHLTHKNSLVSGRARASLNYLEWHAKQSAAGK